MTNHNFFSFNLLIMRFIRNATPPNVAKRNPSTNFSINVSFTFLLQSGYIVASFGIIASQYLHFFSGIAPPHPYYSINHIDFLNFFHTILQEKHGREVIWK